MFEFIQATKNGREMGEKKDRNPVLQKTIWLANPRGFCAGVIRAVQTVEIALKKYGAPIYVRHEIVHNKRVIDDLRRKGAIFVESVDDIPEGAVTIFSAHGVSRNVKSKAGFRSLQTIDATCPLVSKVHKQGQNYAQKGYEIIFIGHKGHAEVEATLGQIDGKIHLINTVKDIDNLRPLNPARLAYITQTTLSVDDTRHMIKSLTERFPQIIGPNTKDICYATQNRQQAVRDMADKIDLLLVVGAHNSSNTNRLCEIGTALGIQSYLVPDRKDFDPRWLEGKYNIGITAGASAPDVLIDELLMHMRQFGYNHIEHLNGIKETVKFDLPANLREVELREKPMPAQVPA